MVFVPDFNEQLRMTDGMGSQTRSSNCSGLCLQGNNALTIEAKSNRVEVLPD